ncbi:hypothetical protein [Myxosarcina sp. GI1]|uniref:hypothetical protein n=1 Tax=Myxosarcina sp. GI1 TaxID=1541065 RepID=UPI00055F712D|nr:hypothetical protein [Myxosarcina sp. GI1]
MKQLSVLALTISIVANFAAKSAWALPPPDDIPEEILRTEIILEARSPIDSKPLSAAEYAELEAKLAERAYPQELNSDIEELIFLLQIRKFFKTIIPFY